MTILAEQILLMESEVMADTGDGGGRMSGRDVDDGQINNTFPDISRLDRVYGRTQLRKLFLAVMTTNQDTLLGAHTILTKLPADPRVKVTLFKTGSHTDRRTDAQDRIESYVVKSTEAPFFLLGTQLAGQRAISCLQRFEQPIPAVGSVFCLVDKDNGEQYVRVTEVEAGRGVFTYQNGSSYVDFQRRTLTLSLANPLDRVFIGTSPVTPLGRDETAARVMATQVADASKYYSTAALTAPAAPGDMTLNVDSVFANLVPSAQSELLLADMQAAVSASPIAPASTAPINVTATNPTINPDGFAVYYAGGGIMPGTLQISTAGYGTYRDNGGALAHQVGNNYLDSGQVDYAEGRILFKATSSGLYAATVTISFIPAAAPSVSAETWATAVTLATRGYNYVFQTPQPPAPGTVVVEYMALGNWYRATDAGNGLLTGDGVGTVDYDTGTITLTLLTLPDVDSSIIWSWGESTSFRVQDGATVPANDVFEHQAAVAIAPGSVSITWTVESTPYTMTDNGAGSFTGDGTGSIDYGAGLIKYRPSTAYVNVTLQYNAGVSPSAQQTFTPALSGSNLNLTIAGAPLAAGSVSVSLRVTRNEGTHGYVKQFVDDAQGHLTYKGAAVGTINYTSGAVTLAPLRNVYEITSRFDYSLGCGARM